MDDLFSVRRPRTITPGTSGSSTSAWRLGARLSGVALTCGGKTLPAIAAFKPDLISSPPGSDAHAKDEIQTRGRRQGADYERLTEELCKIANTPPGRVICPGRVPHPGRRGVRVWARRPHLRAMFRENKETWNAEACQKELDHELKQRRLQKEAQEAARAAAEGARAREEAAGLAAQQAAAANGGDEEAAAAAAAAAVAAGAPQQT